MTHTAASRNGHSTETVSENPAPADGRSYTPASLQCASATWSEPQPLGIKLEPEPYPVDALPEPIRAAVDEVAGFVKAPIPLFASSAIAALSIAAQAHADAKRAERLQGPVGAYFLTIADSGERKSTSDGFFMSAIREYQEQQAIAKKPEMQRYKADIGCVEGQARRVAVRNQRRRQKRQTDRRTKEKTCRSSRSAAQTPKSAEADTRGRDTGKPCISSGDGMAVCRNCIIRSRDCFWFAWHGLGQRHAQSRTPQHLCGTVARTRSVGELRSPSR